MQILFKPSPFNHPGGSSKLYAVIDKGLGHGGGKAIASIQGRVSTATWGSNYSAHYIVRDATGKRFPEFFQNLADAKDYARELIPDLHHVWKTEVFDKGLDFNPLTKRIDNTQGE